MLLFAFIAGSLPKDITEIVNIFARIKLRKKSFPKEISEALEALLEQDEVAFSF